MVQPGSCVVSIDLGTSGPRVAVVGEDGRILAAHSEPVGFEWVGEHGAEQDPEALWEATRTSVAKAVAASGVPRERILALICGSQYSSLVPVDESGSPVGPLYLYLDQRGARHARRMLARRPELVSTWFAVHGRPCGGTGEDSLSSLLFVREERPRIYERAHCFLEPMDYVTARFTGRCAANQCTIVMLLLGDNRRFGTQRYHPELVEGTGVDPAKLPPLSAVDAVLGPVHPELAEAIGLSPDTQVIAAVNDSQTLAMGTGSFQGRHLGLSIGTTIVPVTFADRLDEAHDRLLPMDPANLLMPMPGPLESPKGHHLVMAELGLAGKALEHLLHQVVYADDRLGRHGREDLYGAVEEAVAQVPAGSDKLLYLPWLSGSWMPAADEAVRGGYLNVSLKTTRQHLVRATLEGVAYQLRWAMPGLAGFVGHGCEAFRFGGGGARSAAWAQILADVTGVPVEVMEAPQYTNCRGGAMLAYQRLGRLGLDELAGWVRASDTREPDPATRARYDELAEQYVKVHEALTPIFRQLNAPASG